MSGSKPLSSSPRTAAPGTARRVLPAVCAMPSSSSSTTREMSVRIWTSDGRSRPSRPAARGGNRRRRREPSRAVDLGARRVEINGAARMIESVIVTAFVMRARICERRATRELPRSPGGGGRRRMSCARGSERCKSCAAGPSKLRSAGAGCAQLVRSGHGNGHYYSSGDRAPSSPPPSVVRFLPAQTRLDVIDAMLGDLETAMNAASAM